MSFQNFLLNTSISIISSQDVRNAIANKTKLFKKEIKKELNNNLLSIKKKLCDMYESYIY